MDKLIKKISKDWGMALTYKDWPLKEMFIFQSQFSNITIHTVIATERTKDVEFILSK